MNLWQNIAQVFTKANRPQSDLPTENLTVATGMGMLKKQYPAYIGLRVEDINLARARALSPIMPDRLHLQQMYKRCFDDAHLQAQVNNRMGKVLATKYEISGMEVTHEGISQMVIYQTIKHILEALYYGYTLLDFNFDNDRIKVTSIDRESIIPERKIVYIDRQVGEFIYYQMDGKMVADNIIEIDTEGLGILQYALFYVLQKLTATQDWCSFSERYGTPPIIIQMEDKDPAKIQNRKEFIEGFGAGLGVVADKADTITVLNAFNGSYETYSNLIKFCNDEVSKLISGGTMISDSGSSRAQSQVHENTFNSLVESDKMFVTSVFNDKIMPMFKKIIGKGGEFKFTESLGTGLEVDEHGRPIDDTGQAGKKPTKERLENFPYHPAVRNLYRGVMPTHPPG